MTPSSYIQRPNRPLRAYALWYLVFLYIPVLFLPLFLFNDSIYIAFPLKGFTTEWYQDLFANEPLFAALINSLKVGAVASVLATALGIFAAKAVTRYRLPGRKPLIGFIMLPLVIPGIVFGVALLILMSRLGVPLSLYTVTLGHTILCIPFAVATLIPRFEGFDRSIEEVSADLGETAWGTFWRVTLPVVFPGIVASLLPVFHRLVRRVHHGVLHVRYRSDLADLHVGAAAASPIGCPASWRSGRSFWWPHSAWCFSPIGCAPSAFRPRARGERDHVARRADHFDCRRKQDFRRGARRRERVPGHRPRRIFLAPRPLGMRQDDPAADVGRIRSADVGRDLHRRPVDGGGAAAPSPGEHGVPELCHLPAPERAREYRLRTAQGEIAAPAARRPGRGNARADQTARLRRAPLARAVGRRASAGGAGAGVDQAAKSAVARRTARRARQETARADAVGAAGVAALGRHHLRLCHPRPGRSADHVGPHRGDGGGPRAASRHPNPAL